MDRTQLLLLMPWLAGGAAFLLVISIWFIGFFLWLQQRARHQEQIKQRLELGLDGHGEGAPRVLELWHQGKRRTTVVPGLPQRVGRFTAICNEMGWRIPGYVLGLALFLIFIAMFGAGLLITRDLLLAAGIGAASTGLVWTLLNGRVKKKLALFEGQLADALGLAARSLKAGHPLSGAFRVIAEEMEDPIRTVFQNLAQEQDLGVTMEDALKSMARQTTSEDLKMFVATVVIQMQSGGNLADTMARLANVMRDRIRLVRKARALTAQTQLSKNILIGVPFVTAIMIQVVSPEYLNPLVTTGTGRILLVIAAVLLYIGAWVMNKMATLKY